MPHPGGYRIEDENLELIDNLTMTGDEMRMAYASDIEIPPVIDLRAHIPRRSQKNEGSCQGHAQTFATEAVHWMKSGEFKRFSPDAAYYWAQAMDGIRGDSGSTISGGLRVALEIGALEEEFMPYTPRYNPQDVPPDGKDKAEPFKARKGSRLRTYREIVEWWARGFGGVWWGISWGLRESRPGWITQFRAGGGGHAIGIGMWGEAGGPEIKMESDGLPPWLWQTNSWTDSPQEVSINGYCHITRDAVEKALEHPHTVVVGITDMESIHNRPINWLDNPVI